MTNPFHGRSITPGNADIMIELSGVNLLFKIFRLPLNPRHANEYNLKTKNEG